MSETIYKLLDQNMESHRGCRWTLGEWKESEAVGDFCAPGGFHAYEHPLLAVLHNPIHANIQSPRLFVAEVAGEIIRDGQMKLKAQRMRIVEEISVPIITTEQRVAYAILCAKAVYSSEKWNRWADGWLSGSDRAAASAWATERAMVSAWAAAGVAARAAARAAVWAAEAAARVTARTTEAAAWAAWEAAVVRAAEAAAWATEGVAKAAEAATWGAEAAGAAAGAAARAAARAAELDLIACAEKAMEEAQ